MYDIDEMKLRRLDLTVMLIFLGLMRRQKASDVASDMGLTQSSISHALKRLRDIFEDDLFLRRPFGLEPTAVALALEPQIRSAVETLNSTLASQRRFDPEQTEGVLRIGALDYVLTTLFPKFIERVHIKAPNLRVTARSMVRKDAYEALIAGEIDLAVGFYWDVPDRLEVQPLLTDGYSVVAHAGHALVSRPPSLEFYLKARHLLVSPGGDLDGLVDQTLAARGLARHVCVNVPLFMPALAILASSDLVSTLPTRLVELFAKNFDLAYQPVPIDLRTLKISAVRHARDAKNPLHDWVTAELSHSA